MKFNEKLGFKTAAGIRSSIEAIDYYPFHSHETYIEFICSSDILPPTVMMTKAFSFLR